MIRLFKDMSIEYSRKNIFSKCDHFFKEVKRESYMDYSCFRVIKITFMCEKCNKKKVKKFY